MRHVRRKLDIAIVGKKDTIELKILVGILRSIVDYNKVYIICLAS